MKNGWTGGQYSLFRALFGTYLFVHFVHLIPWGSELFSNSGVLPHASDSPLVQLFPNVLALWDAPSFVTGLLLAAAGLSVLFILGLYDRAASLGLWYIWACLHGRMPLIINPGMPYVGWLLLAHACLPSAPYGAWSARGRVDPGGSWQMPPLIFAAAWILMALGYSYSGYTKLVSPSWLDGTAVVRVLDSPLARPGPLREALLRLPASMMHWATWGALALELSFAPLALIRRLRPWLWLTMLTMHLSLIGLIDFADLSLGMVMLHLFTFDPGWIRPNKAPTETIFCDSHGGLCRLVVRFVLAEDRAGDSFRAAPLDRDTFRTALPGAERTALSDTVVVRTAEGTLLTRSAAVLHLLGRLGGAWRLLGGLLRMVPPLARDGLYDAIAWSYHRLVRRPLKARPLRPEEPVSVESGVRGCHTWPKSSMT